MVSNFGPASAAKLRQTVSIPHPIDSGLRPFAMVGSQISRLSRSSLILDAATDAPSYYSYAS